MQTFKQFLMEARAAPLYHATSFAGFSGIMSKDTIDTTTDKYAENERGSKPTVFFTRNLRHAKWYAEKRAGGRGWVVIQVDQQKLNNNYKITPIHNWNDNYYKKSHSVHHKREFHSKVKQELMRDPRSHGNEFEEVVDKPIKNALKYITTIYSNLSKQEVANTSPMWADVIDKLDSHNIEWKQA